jgi:hypothetical protein
MMAPLPVYFFSLDDTLMDYPDSPAVDGEPVILDMKDGNQQSSSDYREQPPGTSRVDSEDDSRDPHSRCHKRARDSVSSATGTETNRPSLPPIYHTVGKLRQNKVVIRHLNGGGDYTGESTTYGAPLSAKEQIGSFLNVKDKRLNHTTHRHDHAKARNISCSFNPSTLICTSCQGGHQVLRRTVEGGDVGMDNPPVFILSDQNFPSMVPAEGEGECLKVILIENCALADLVEVFLGLTRGFDMPAGAVVLMSSASHAAAVSTADYASDFVRAWGALRGAFAGAVTVLYGVPFLLGGTENSAALRAIAEIEHWVRLTSRGTDTVSATRAIFADSLYGTHEHHDQQCILRLASSQNSTEKSTYITTGFGNLKTAAEPISEEFEKYLLTSLIEELNNLFPVNLATDFICDRFMDSDVFDETMMDRTALILIGASHLRNIGRFFKQEDWRVIDLTTPGWRISENSVKNKVEEIKNLAEEIDVKTSVCILQLYYNSIYLVGGPGGVKHLPARDPTGKYHVGGPLIVADKPGVKDLTAKLMPLLKELGECKKVFMTPLARYWLAPCCNKVDHLVNYSEPGYLPKLNNSISALRDCIRDSLFTRRVSNYRVLCPNKMIGLGPRSGGISDSEAREHADRWGSDPVHPSAAVYQKSLMI